MTPNTLTLYYWERNDETPPACRTEIITRKVDEDGREWWSDQSGFTREPEWFTDYCAETPEAALELAIANALAEVIATSEKLKAVRAHWRAFVEARASL